MVTLITGGTGKLGRELIKVYPECLHPTRQLLDITSETQVRELIREHRPNKIIHTAALTGIKQCEEDKKRAYLTNVIGTKNLVKACLDYTENSYLVYISTACVFYGDRGDYTENDIPYPKNFYSLTKLLGEFVVSQSGLKKYLIIRTNFVPREKWPYPKAFTDRYGTYLFADDLALAIKKVTDDNITGLAHVCGEEKLSMFDLARITTPDIQPITMAEYNGPPLTIDMTLRSLRIRPFRLRRKL